MNSLRLLAQDEEATTSLLSGPGSTAKGVVFAVAIMFSVAFLIFLWAAFWRKPRHHKHSYHHHPDAALPRREKRKPRLFGRRHRRHHRKEDRPMNPTLAQVGGLPPERRDKPPTH